MLSSVRVVGESETGEETLRWESKACWYLLAGATRRVRTALSPDACEKTARLRLVVDTDRGPVTATLPVTPDMCK